MRFPSTCTAARAAASAAAIAALLALAPRVAAAETYFYRGCYHNPFYDEIIRCASVRVTTLSGFGAALEATGDGGISEALIYGSLEGGRGDGPADLPPWRHPWDLYAAGPRVEGASLSAAWQDEPLLPWSSWQPRVIGGASAPWGYVSLVFSYVPAIPSACPSGRCLTEERVGVMLVPPESLVAPEPSTAALTGAGLLVVGARMARRRRR